MFSLARISLCLMGFCSVWNNFWDNPIGHYQTVHFNYLSIHPFTSTFSYMKSFFKQLQCYRQLNLQFHLWSFPQHFSCLWTSHSQWFPNLFLFIILQTSIRWTGVFRRSYKALSTHTCPAWKTVLLTSWCKLSLLGGIVFMQHSLENRYCLSLENRYCLVALRALKWKYLGVVSL